MCTRKELHPWIFDFVVVPEERCRGVGHVLVSALLNLCRRLGLTKIYLWTKKES